MPTLILRFPSITYAQQGQKVLEQAGLPSRLTRIGAHGCAHGLEINALQKGEAIHLLDEAGILYTL